LSQPPSFFVVIDRVPGEVKIAIAFNVAEYAMHDITAFLLSSMRAGFQAIIEASALQVNEKQGSAEEW
jgi:hypothetical protein